MKRIKPLSLMFGVVLSLGTTQWVWADAAVDFADLTLSRPTKDVQSTPDISLTGATTSSRGCLGYDGAKLRERAAPYHDTIMTYATRYGVDHNLIKSVIAVESCYNVTALSPKSAMGLMQLIPATASRFGITDPSDSSQNIRGGARYLAWLIARFKGDVSKALAGYNAGEGAVDKYGGIPPYRETQNYVVNVLGLYQRLSNKSTPTVMASATQALQEDLEGISAELTAALRGDAPLPDINSTLATTATVTKQPDLPTIDEAAAKAVAMATRSTLNLNTAARPNANNQQGRVIPVSANKTFNAPRVDAANELAARVIDGLVRGGPPIHHGAPAQRSQQQGRQGRPANNNPTVRLAQAQGRPVAPQRVSHTYFTALTKPGRGGWEANRARAPGLYKQ